MDNEQHTPVVEGLQGAISQLLLCVGTTKEGDVACSPLYSGKESHHHFRHSFYVEETCRALVEAVIQAERVGYVFTGTGWNSLVQRVGMAVTRGGGKEVSRQVLSEVCQQREEREVS